MLTPVVGGTPLPVANMLAWSARVLRRDVARRVGVGEAESANVVGDAEASVRVRIRHRDRVGREAIVRRLQHVAVGQPAVGVQSRQRIARLLGERIAGEETLGLEATATQSSAGGIRDAEEDESRRGGPDGERSAGLIEVGEREVVVQRLADRRNDGRALLDPQRIDITRLRVRLGDGDAVDQPETVLLGRGKRPGTAIRDAGGDHQRIAAIEHDPLEAVRAPPVPNCSFNA